MPPNKMNPLSPTALDDLRSLMNSPSPTQEFNPGVVNRLIRGNGTEPYVESVQLPSPYKSHKGRLISHLRITEAGVAAVKAGQG